MNNKSQKRNKFCN